jgi:hypothetical protein
MRSLQKLALCAAIVAACGTPQPGQDVVGDTAATDTRTDTSTDRPNPTDGMSLPDADLPDADLPDSTSTPDADMPDSMSTPDADMPDSMSTPDSSPDVTCAMGQSACGATCVDTQTDNMNCGACGTACAMGQTCTAGVCACAMGQTSCGTPAMCVNTQTDNNNCGACGTACPMGQSCQMGACRIDCMAPRSICGAGAMMACVDRQTDVNNCGTCGNVCPMGQSCVAGACACPMGQTACGTPAMCINTQTDNANCGGCGRACGAGQTCTAGVCTCPMGQTVCPAGGGAMSACRNLQTDGANCGACGTTCAMGRVCAAGVCQASCTGATPNLCGMGAMSFCTNFQTDRSNCGACGTVCGANANCTTGMCRPTNDTAATASVLPFEIGSRRVIAGSTVNAATDTGACMGSNNSVYYRIDIIARSIVYVDTFTSTTNTVVGFRTTTAGPSTSCNDNSCAGMQSQTAIIANVGPLYIEVGNAMGGTGAFNLRYTIQLAGGGDAAQITPTTMVQTLDGTTAGGTNGVAQSCGSMTSAPEDAFYFFTCPADPARAFHASSCGSSYDTLIETRSVGVPVACNDDAGLECGLGSSATANIPAGAGLHVVYMDGFSSGSTGAYRMQYSFGCNDGFASCRGACAQVSSFNNSSINCGACGVVCPAGQMCANSACGVVPANTFPTVQQPSTPTTPSGGPGGAMATDDCPVGQVLVGVNVSTDGTTVRSMQPFCSTPALGGTAPSRISFAGNTNLPTRGPVTGPVQARRCPEGYALTGISGRAGTAINQLVLQCSRVNVTGMGPYTIQVLAASSQTTPYGNLTMGAPFTNACPAGQVVHGFVTRSMTNIDAIGLRCERLRVFRAATNNAATSTLPFNGVFNMASMMFSDNCPAGQILAGVSVRSTAAGIHQLAITCRPYSGLAGVGGWQYTSGADTVGTLRGTATMGQATANAVCGVGSAPSQIFVQNNVAASYVGRLAMTCTRLGSDVLGAPTYTPSGSTGLVGAPMGSGGFPNANCATGQLATGLEIRATANIQQLALRCTPVTSL